MTRRDSESDWTMCGCSQDEAVNQSTLIRGEHGRTILVLPRAAGLLVVLLLALLVYVSKLSL